MMMIAAATMFLGAGAALAQSTNTMSNGMSNGTSHPCPSTSTMSSGMSSGSSNSMSSNNMAPTTHCPQTNTMAPAQ
jgi:hypothetical protein